MAVKSRESWDGQLWEVVTSSWSTCLCSRITGHVVLSMGGRDAPGRKYRETPVAWFSVKMYKVFA